MLRFFRSPKTTPKLAALVTVFLLSFSLYGLYCMNTVAEVKINGPYYQRIVQGKDVIADILPPPEYLVEAYLTAFQLLESSSETDARMLSARILTLKDNYLARHAYWESTLPEDPLKKALIRDSFTPAQRMLEALESEFLPAIAAGRRTEAEAVLNAKVTPNYTAHRAAVDAAVELAKRRNREDEAQAEVAVQSRSYGQVVVGILLLCMLAVFSAYVIQQVETSSAAESLRSNSVSG